MSGQHPNPPQSRIVPALVIGGLCYAALDHIGPLFYSGEINPLATLAVGGLVLSVIAFCVDILKIIANFCLRLKAQTPLGLKGTARFIDSWQELRSVVAKRNEPALWLGIFKGRAVRITIEACACIVGSSGSGKSIKSFITSIISLFGACIVFFDFKSDVMVMLYRFIIACGGKPVVFNLGGLHEDIVGSTAHYNPLIIVSELLDRKRGLELIVDTVREMCLRLEPDRPQQNEGSFWLNSNRRWGAAAIFFEVLQKREKATLGGVLQLLNDRTRLKQIARFFAGRLELQEGEGIASPDFMNLDWAKAGIHDPADIQDFADFIQGLASSLCDLLDAPDSRLADSILAGSQEMLSGFEITTRAHKIMSKTTIRFSVLKEQIKGWFVFCFMFNPELIAAQAKTVSILTYCMFWELKHHPNKNKDVWVLIDEATNIPFVKIDELITWARSYGVRLVFWFQNFARWKKAFGPTALEVVESESEVILIMPHTRNQDTLDRVSKSIGQASIVTPHYRTNRQLGAFGTETADYREEGKPVFSADELRRTDKGLARIKNKPWVQLDLYSYAEIYPWRLHVDGSPMHGFKPYLKPIKYFVSGRFIHFTKRASAVLNAMCVIAFLVLFFLKYSGGILP